MLLQQHIDRVSLIDFCPYCGVPWNVTTDIMAHLRDKFGLTESKDLVTKAIEYGWTIQKDRTTIRRLKILLTNNPAYPLANYYMCPDCSSMWLLHNDIQLSEHEKSMHLALLSANHPENNVYDLHARSK